MRDFLEDAWREYWPAILLGFGMMFVIGGVEYNSWRSAGIQAKVYQRQGIEISQYEVWCGAKPVGFPYQSDKERK